MSTCKICIDGAVTRRSILQTTCACNEAQRYQPHARMCTIHVKPQVKFTTRKPFCRMSHFQNGDCFGAFNFANRPKRVTNRVRRDIRWIRSCCRRALRAVCVHVPWVCRGGPTLQKHVRSMRSVGNSGPKSEAGSPDNMNGVGLGCGRGSMPPMFDATEPTQLSRPDLVKVGSTTSSVLVATRLAHIGCLRCHFRPMLRAPSPLG